MLQLTMSRLFFYVPFLYLYHTRQRSLRKLLSWALADLLPARMPAPTHGALSPATLSAVVLRALHLPFLYDPSFTPTAPHIIHPVPPHSTLLHPHKSHHPATPSVPHSSPT